MRIDRGGWGWLRGVGLTSAVECREVSDSAATDVLLFLLQSVQQNSLTCCCAHVRCALSVSVILLFFCFIFG